MKNRPSIIIFTVNPNLEILKEICAGIEEEGVLYDTITRSGKDLNTLSYEAANEAILGSGIGVVDSSAALILKNIPKGENVFQIQNPSIWQSRNLGANAARAVKKMPFKEL